MELNGINLGLCMCGSFCTYKKSFEAVERLKKLGVNIYPIMSKISYSTDTRFGKALEFRKKLEDITENKIINSIFSAEPIGPRNFIDIMLVAPCTGNTIAKLNNGITDGSVTMACKSHLRNNKPLVLCLATNDALGINLKNIGGLMVRKNIFFVPFGQDNSLKKPLSMISDFEKIEETLIKALHYEQIQPILI